MGVFETLGLIFKFLPELIGLVREAIEGLKGIASDIERRNKLNQMTRALQKAKATKDTSDLEGIFNGGKKP